VFPFDAPRTPMEARTREALPDGAWSYEPKWDGFRVLCWATDGGGPRLDSRNRKPLLRYFPELVAALEALPEGTVVDGEILVVRNGQTDFDALSERIHPADSRIRLLAEQTPARIVSFDLLSLRGDDMRGRPFRERRPALESIMGGLENPWHLTPSTEDRATGERWFHEFEAAGCDGIVAKPADGPYVEGKREMVKVKHRRTVDAVVAGYRIHKDGRGVGSLLLGLYDDSGQLHFVGHCSNFSDEERVGLLSRLEPLHADGDGPFGKDARQPGEPSRWTGGKDLSWYPLEPALVCEVSYGQVTGIRFRHATRFERWRPDKDPRDCGFDQVARPAGPTFEEVVGG
jgi:ATP-dependent DNA ligase